MDLPNASVREMQPGDDDDVVALAEARRVPP